MNEMYIKNNYKEGLQWYIITNLYKSKIQLCMHDKMYKIRKKNRKTNNNYSLVKTLREIQ